MIFDGFKVTTNIPIGDNRAILEMEVFQDIDHLYWTLVMRCTQCRTTTTMRIRPVDLYIDRDLGFVTTENMRQMHLDAFHS